MTQPPSIAFIVTCMGRLTHLRESLPRLAAQPASECILVDFSCPEGCGAWAAANHPAVRVVRVPGQEHFNLARARNAGAGSAGAPWLCFVDADVLVAPRFAQALQPLLRDRRVLRASPLEPELWGTHVVARADFWRVGGYDECFEGWGGEDVDFFARLADAGCTSSAFPAWLLQPIHHGEEDRTRFHAEKDREVNRRVNTIYRHAKQDMARLSGAYLSDEVRRALRREAARAASRLPGSLSVGLGRRLLTEDLAMDVRLHYTLSERAPAPVIPQPEVTPAPMPIIVGTGECGSTMLRLMLDRHPDLAMAADTFFIPDFMQIWDDVPQPVGPLLGRLFSDPAWPAYQVDAESLAACVRQTGIADPANLLRAFYQAHATSLGKPRWGDRSLDHLARMIPLAEWFPEVRFVHVVRDPRDVAAAARALAANPPSAADTAARWAATVGTAHAYNPGASRLMEIRFEDLVREPETILRRVCAFLDLPWHPALLEWDRVAPVRIAETEPLASRGGPPAALLRRQYRRAAATPDPTEIGLWRRTLTPGEADEVRMLAGPLMDALGYVD